MTWLLLVLLWVVPLLGVCIDLHRRWLLAANRVAEEALRRVRDPP